MHTCQNKRSSNSLEQSNVILIRYGNEISRVAELLQNGMSILYRLSAYRILRNLRKGLLPLCFFRSDETKTLVIYSSMVEDASAISIQINRA